MLPVQFISLLFELVLIDILGAIWGQWYKMNITLKHYHLKQL